MINVIHRHLSDQDNDSRDFVMGIYPMLQDETCFFLAVDFGLVLELVLKIPVIMHDLARSPTNIKSVPGRG